jgi:uncharacterized repeat protein (TIGR01451 family)
VQAVGGGTLGSGKACVTSAPAAGPATPPPAAGSAAPASPAAKPNLVVHKTGPAKLNIGDTAEFKIEVINQGQGAATNLKVLDHYDPALKPTAASPGSKWTGADLVWQIDALKPGEKLEFGINCECIEQAANACNRVTVTCQEQVRADGEACLAISPPPGGVSVVVAEDADPVRVDEQVKYEITVANHSQAADGQVSVVVTVPQQMSPLRIGTQGPSAMQIDGQAVKFAPVAELRPGDVLHYTVKTRATAPGEAKLRVDVTTRTSKAPLSQEETTRIVPVQ